MKSTSFTELTKQVNLINDMILSDMICGNDSSEEAVNFSKHLLATKYWFSRISYANKKQYLLALLEDVRSAWTLSLLLKSMWNCRPKDAVMSVCEKNVWSSYDQAPMDHNRTALPTVTLAQVMKNDRMWFLTLEPESQCMVLCELLTISGGPVMWAVLRRAEIIYDYYRNEQLQNLQENIAGNDSSLHNKHQSQRKSSADKAKKDHTKHRKGSAGETTNETDKQEPPIGEVYKELEANIAAWDATIKSLRDSFKLEEIEMTLNDGTKRKIWKVKRPEPEATETVDLIQLLPSHIGKRILSYLPRAQLGDYARVNRYWAYLVDEFRAEIAAREKIDAEINKLHELMLRHDTSTDVVETMETRVQHPSSQGFTSIAPSMKARLTQPSARASEKSGGVYSMRHFLNEKLNKPSIHQTPIRNMAEMTERLDRRGAADENIWKWCENVLKLAKSLNKSEEEENKRGEGVLTLGSGYFPCRMMKENLKVPLDTPLCKDPAITTSIKPKKNISDTNVTHQPKELGVKRYNLWTRNLSGLYPVYKISSHQSPV